MGKRKARKPASRQVAGAGALKHKLQGTMIIRPLFETQKESAGLPTTVTCCLMTTTEQCIALIRSEQWTVW